MPITYSQAGVSIEEGEKTVDSIKDAARRTFSKNVLTGIGSFGAAFRIKGYKQPVLISSADGIGTKLKVAILAGKHDTVGECLVNHCVNDIMVQGADPLFFLDYFAMGELDSEIAGSVIRGIARGCERNGCALIGGETAEMPGLYQKGEYDVAGFIVGACEEKGLITGAKIAPGDVLIGLKSDGLHTNGYSLARKLLFEVAKYDVHHVVPELGESVGDALLHVHLSYAPAMRALRKGKLLKGAAHITGGGITDNTPRMLPPGTNAKISTKAWEVPVLFELMREIGKVPEDDWRRTFNLGIGMIVCVPAADAPKALKILAKTGFPGVELGKVVKGKKSEKPKVLYI
ncbi:phosphoribosylformylglycinamidine cyclo-ligase [Bryobacter aggregatus]|uniref:phosphoribosylformylglycinamidine cyclo-ligase n=1 Tax=Bryobacter aggregatus TaxID=360054 RepID=UPI0005698FFF|nr:phosphoribosylformylglycinamidine cyclo-ligase [Bryobacter aggregatus]